MFQGGALFSALTVKQNVEAPMREQLQRTRFPSVTRAAKTHMTARQGEPDSNLHPKREQRCALSVDLRGLPLRC